MSSDVVRDVKALLASHGTPPREVYLDLENAGLVLPEALRAMIEAYEKRGFGHPSITHKAGWEAYELLYESAEILSRVIGAKPEEITFTHSCTEANNLAVVGSALANKSGRRKIVVSAIEHLSVIFPAERLAPLGYKVVKVPVDSEGFVNLDALSEAVDSETLLVSVGIVNHEIGTVQDLRAVVDIVRDKSPETLVHTDAADALAKVEIDVEKLGVDLATFSSHKVYGPRGAGAIYVREGVALEPVVHGQLSAQKLWPGVENVPAIAGFSKALETLHRRRDEYVGKMRRLRDMLISGILSSVDHVLLNGPEGDRRAPDNVNVSFLYCEGEALTVELSLRGVYVSSGSACTSRILEPSHVLLAIGRRYEEAHGSVLMKVWPLHSEDDVKYAVEQIRLAVERIRSISPVRGVA